ncbi:hypothetical protein GBAR_LOCUS21813 [Geodia barretti]|uniref:Uncharacterized protein n=1 Tax=Geodia barretti TaxID=519541 RepID=A0AA35WZ32_GEOBA|nr:hypothetical protein GBAR_LOCUS21813 [Geodia barretti]
MQRAHDAKGLHIQGGKEKGLCHR